MTDAEFLTKLSALYKIVLSFRKDDDYEINQTQMDKLCNLYRFFLDTAGKLDGEVEPFKLVPKEEHGGVVAKFLVFDVYGENVKRFSDAISACSAIGVEALADGRVCIDCTVPNVFVEKAN